MAGDGETISLKEAAYKPAFSGWFVGKGCGGRSLDEVADEV